jgi:hypothetical protein
MATKKTPPATADPKPRRILAETHLATTPVAPLHCHRCGAIVLYGLAEGLPTRVGMTPLDTLGEYQAIRAGLWTYTLTRPGLVHRDASRILGNHLTGPVLADHKCGREMPADRIRKYPMPVVRIGEPNSGQQLTLEWSAE